MTFCKQLALLLDFREVMADISSADISSTLVRSP